MLTGHFTFTGVCIASPWFSVRSHTISGIVRECWVFALSASVLRSSTAWLAAWTVLAPLGPVRISYHYRKKKGYKEKSNIRNLVSGKHSIQLITAVKQRRRRGVQGQKENKRKIEGRFPFIFVYFKLALVFVRKILNRLSTKYWFQYCEHRNQVVLQVNAQFRDTQHRCIQSVATYLLFLCFRRIREIVMIKKYIYIVTLLLQGCELQLRDCWLGPTQGLPPFAGAGLSHLRLLYWDPPPHVTLHTPYLLHEDHLPFTVEIWKVPASFALNG